MELETVSSDTAGQQFGAVINPAHAEQFFAASGHTFAEMLALADQGQAAAAFPAAYSPARDRAHEDCPRWNRRM